MKKMKKKMKNEENKNNKASSALLLAPPLHRCARCAAPRFRSSAASPLQSAS
jgi:hypothetical protein